MSDAALESRFTARLVELLPEIEAAQPHLLVAFSGGLDSTVLLHMLRFRATAFNFTLSAAHFDHRMREESGRDAEWVHGLCRAWGVALQEGAAERAIRGEDEARRARYAFLRRSSAGIGADYVVTAHHADDQAETVLFRIVRGTGIAGLRGIPSRTRSGLLRPLLPFWREELEDYARSNRLRWRADATNESDTPARNRIRNVLLPEIERSVARGARKNLVALAELAKESEAGWRSVVREAEEAVLRQEGSSVLVARAELRGYHPAIRTRVFRKALRRFGTVPGRIGTRSALTFIIDAPSGREFQLPGGLSIRTEFEVARIERVAGRPADLPLVIEREAAERGVERAMRIGGRSYRVTVRTTDRPGSPPPAGPSTGRETRIPMSALHFPLSVRARNPGDRIATIGGTKTLKKLMLERRVPLTERDSVPVLEDSSGKILWVAGVEVGVVPEAQPGELLLHFVIQDDRDG